MSSADMYTFMHSVNFGGSGSQDSGGFTACPKRAIGALGERGGKPGSFNRLVGPGGPWIQKEGQEAYPKHSTSIHSALLVLKEFTELLSIEQYVCMYVCMYACMHVCMYAWMGGWMDGWMYGCMYVFM